MTKSDFIAKAIEKIEANGFTAFKAEENDDLATFKLLHNVTGHSYDLKLVFSEGNFISFDLGGDQSLDHQTRKNYDTFDYMDIVSSCLREVSFGKE